MRIAVLSDQPDDTRVAATPETVKKYIALGAQVIVEAGAGNEAGVPDAEFETSGAQIAPTRSDAVRDADIVLKVRRPAASDISGAKPGALVIAVMDPHGHEAELRGLADARVSAFRDGVDAADHPRSGHGRPVQPGEPRRLPRRDRRRS
jgi:NAD(P) transhydrogenase subunit alpha